MVAIHPLKARQKPSKPYPSFPLTPHNNGQWCKKVRGKVHFFGIWAAPKAAFDRYLRLAADLQAGSRPSPETISGDQITVKDVCNHFLTHQMRKVETGEIRGHTFEDYRRAADSFARFVGTGRPIMQLMAGDFEEFRRRLVRQGLNKAKGMGVHALNRTVTMIRSIFKYAYEIGLIEKPVRYGPGFARLPASSRRKSRRATEMANGKRLFTAAEVTAMLETAASQLRAMVLLGINGGFGNTDCARLPRSAVDPERAVIEFDRPKTGVERVVPLWPETVTALREAFLQRPKPAAGQHEKLMFLTIFGRPWVREQVYSQENTGIEKVVMLDSIGQEFNKLLVRVGLKRKGIGFYTLRHTFRTWADEVKDQHAIHRIMGHTIPGMSGIYVEEISLERLRAVTEHVRRKLFSEQTAPTPAQPPAAV